MLQYIRSLIWRRLSYGIHNSEYNFGVRTPRTKGAIASNDEAMTLSPFYAALRLYQNTIGSLNLVTYRKDDDGGRQRAKTHPAYSLLHERPNPAQSSCVFFESLIRDLFLSGNAYVVIRWRGNGSPLALYPVPSSSVDKIYVDDEWNKAYQIRTEDGYEIYEDEDIIHFFINSEDGIQGKSIITHAAESLGLHRQVLESANAYFVNSVRPSIIVRYPNMLTAEALENFKTGFKNQYQGTDKTGSIPVIDNGGTIEKSLTGTAEDMQIVQALSLSTATIAQWFGLTPLQLGDLSRGTYSNLAADNAAFYQKSIRPILHKIELEFNAKLFGAESANYCEFLLDGILRGDPAQQQTIFNGYIQSGVMTRSEVREFLNLPPIPGLEIPLHPLNQGEASIENSQPLSIETTQNKEVPVATNANNQATV